MNFYNCPYVDIIPFRNGNEYDEGYGCAVTHTDCKMCGCEMTPEEAERLISLSEEGSVLNGKIDYGQ